MDTDLASLLAQCRAGHEDAWRALVDRYASLVYGVARSHGFRDERADDIAQSVFTTLVTRLGSIREPDALPGWLVTTTRRACWRLARAPAMVPIEGVTPRVEPDAAERDERRAMLAWALRSLGPPCEELLRAMFLRHASPRYEQLAEELGMPVGSIGPTRGRCLAKLANALAERLGDAW